MWTDPDTGTKYYVDSSNYRGDLTYCPKDGAWSYTWHWCGDGSDPGPKAYDAGVYVDNYRR